MRAPPGRPRARLDDGASRRSTLPATREVTETWFVLEGAELRVVDVREFTWPVNDDIRPFLETGGCGADLDPYD